MHRGDTICAQRLDRGWLGSRDFAQGNVLANDATSSRLKRPHPARYQRLSAAAILAPPAPANDLASLRMRAVATLILLLVHTLIGQGLGPYLAGGISDYLTPEYGQESLRYTLMAIGLVNL